MCIMNTIKLVEYGHYSCTHSIWLLIYALVFQRKRHGIIQNRVHGTH